jgi:hypothetical protein
MGMLWVSAAAHASEAAIAEVAEVEAAIAA